MTYLYVIRQSIQKIFFTKENEMKLSSQAVGALLMTLQKCLTEETDITELLLNWDLEIKDDEVWVSNPPVIAPPIQKTKFEIE